MWQEEVSREAKRRLKAANLQNSGKVPKGIGETDLMKHMGMELTGQRDDNTKL